MSTTILKSTNLKTVTSLIDPTNLIIKNELPLNENGEILYNEKNKIVNESLNYQIGKTWNQISNVTWMIENEYFDMIKEKVKNSEYLCFSNGKPYEPIPLKVFQNTNSSTNLFQSINNDETPLTRNQNSIFDTSFNQLMEPTFYNNLFKNYSNYYLSSLKTTVFSKLLPYDNVIALDVLCKNYGYVPTCSLLLSAIRNSRFKIANYLYDNHKSVSFDYVQFFVNGTVKTNLLISKSSTSENNSMIPIFTDFRYIFKQPLSTIVEICNWIERFSNKLQPFIDYMNKLSSDGTNVINSELNYQVANLLKYFKYFNGKFELLSKLQLEEMKFTIEELKQSIQSFNTNDERVESLIKMILPFNGFYGYGESFTFYQYKYSKINMVNSFVNKDIDPFEFGFLDFDDYKCRKLIIGNEGKTTSLFKCIPLERSRQIQFLNQTINELEISESNYPNRKLNSINLFKVIVGYNDLEFIKLVHNSSLFITRSIPSDIINYIKSNEVLDYILQFITIEFILENKEFNFIRKLISSSKLELLLNLKCNHLEIYNQFYQHLTFDDTDDSTMSKDRSVSFESFKYLYENYQEFEIVYFNQMTSWPINNLYGLDQIDYILFKTPLIKLDFTHFEYINGINSFDNLLDWAIQFNEYAITIENQKKFDFGYNTDKFISKYQILKKSTKELIPVNGDKNELPLVISQDLFKGILRYGDLNSLDYVMTNLFSPPTPTPTSTLEEGSTTTTTTTTTTTPKYYYLLNQLISSCILDGKIEILKHLSTNYSWFFKLDTPDQTNYKEPSFLCGFPVLSLFQNVFRSGNIELLLFFTQDLHLKVDEKIKQQDAFKENDDLLLSFYKKNKIMF